MAKNFLSYPVIYTMFRINNATEAKLKPLEMNYRRAIYEASNVQEIIKVAVWVERITVYA
jgi:hypothetical protein